MTTQMWCWHCCGVYPCACSRCHGCSWPFPAADGSWHLAAAHCCMSMLSTPLPEAPEAQDWLVPLHAREPCQPSRPPCLACLLCLCLCCDTDLALVCHAAAYSLPQIPETNKNLKACMPSLLHSPLCSTLTPITTPHMQQVADAQSFLDCSMKPLQMCPCMAVCINWTCVEALVCLSCIVRSSMWRQALIWVSMT